ncbi:hypothetical protein Agub_g1247 [Astrephomene gubernaculifera]|uniref:Transmembrane protein n=1 Tax=Astrephomene gubernaculifera TaxID=47775 RepID=A0AAD3DF34_9CHLO|nr:hypothetical protein Agub_g1247 [Astrephomene gubernaculifera]
MSGSGNLQSVSVGGNTSPNEPALVLAATCSVEATCAHCVAGPDAVTLTVPPIEVPLTCASCADDKSNATEADCKSNSVYHVAFRIFCEVLVSSKEGFPLDQPVITALFFLLVSAWLQIHLLVVILQSISWQLGPSVSDIASSLYSMSGAPPAPPPSQFGDYFYASNKLAVIISRILVLFYITGVAEDELSIVDIPTSCGQHPVKSFLTYVAYFGALLCPITQACVAGFAVYVTYAYLNKFDTVGEVVLNGVGISFVLEIDNVMGSKLSEAVARAKSLRSLLQLAPANNSNASKLDMARWHLTLAFTMSFISIGYQALCLYCLCNIADWRYNSRTIAVFALALFTTISTMSSGRWLVKLLQSCRLLFPSAFSKTWISSTLLARLAAMKH